MDDGSAVDDLDGGVDGGIDGLAFVIVFGDGDEARYSSRSAPSPSDRFPSPSLLFLRPSRRSDGRLSSVVKPGRGGIVRCGGVLGGEEWNTGCCARGVCRSNRPRRGNSGGGLSSRSRSISMSSSGERMKASRGRFLMSTASPL
ncbi:hypothetical protein ABW21_db0209495 [Orbilia brochopaga]|nr:hypothetical protein ABW21_db0209495 [Drechslerella brochopaga]